jgi:hypothetical protein
MLHPNKHPDKIYMKKNDIVQVSEYFKNYVNEAYNLELLEGLKKAKDNILEIPMNDLEQLADVAYAEGKWTVKELFQHMIDTERIMTYRALRFARFDKTPLPGFEEDEYAANAGVSHRTIKDLVDEFILIRSATIALFSSFNEKMLTASGVASGKTNSVLALGYVITGHQLHHYSILKERYIPLLKK